MTHARRATVGALALVALLTGRSAIHGAGETAPELAAALQRLEKRRFISAKWGTSENNRRARFYTLTPKGRRELTREQTEWRRIAAAIMRILGPAET